MSKCLWSLSEVDTPLACLDAANGICGHLPTHRTLSTHILVGTACAFPAWSAGAARRYSYLAGAYCMLENVPFFFVFRLN